MGGGTGAQIPASGGIFILATVQPAASLHWIGVCVYVTTCAVVCFQVVDLDPVIEDDAELQKYSKVRHLLTVWIIPHLRSLTLTLTPAPAHPHSASRS